MGEIDICVGNYAAYNNGYLIDEWMELPMPDQQLAERMAALQAKAQRLTGELAEEMYVSDVDGRPMGIEVSEFSNIASLNAMAKIMYTMNDDEKDRVEMYLDHESSTLTADEYMNIMMQADEIPAYGYSAWRPYRGSDPVAQAISDSTTPAEKFGWEMVDEKPELKKLLEEDSAISSAFDVERYGQFCADLYDVELSDDGWLDVRACDLDYSMYDHEELVSLANERYEEVAVNRTPSDTRAHEDERVAAIGQNMDAPAAEKPAGWKTR